MIAQCEQCKRPVLAHEGGCPFCASHNRNRLAGRLVVLATPLVLAACYGGSYLPTDDFRAIPQNRGVCGDGTCTIYWDEVRGPLQEVCSQSEDCAPVVCGDGVCSPAEGGWETATNRSGITCWEDCAVCGDGVCAQNPPGTPPEPCAVDCEAR